MRFSPEGVEKGARGRLALLVAIMVAIAAGTAAVSMNLLYRTALDSQRDRLAATARSQARLIEAIARHEREAQYGASDLSRGALAVTLEQLSSAHEQFEGFGETGELTLARLEGDQIVFLLSHRFGGLETPVPVSIDTNLAEPMRRALRGEAGVITGLDYRGAWVLAAYEPVAVLDLGIVAKIDMAEVKAPFFHARLWVSGAALLLIAVGVFLFRRVGDSLVRGLVTSERNYRGLFENSRDAVYVTTRSGEFLDANPAAVELFGFTQADLGMVNARELYVDRRARVAFQRAVGKDGSVRDFEAKLRRKDGTEMDCLLTSSVCQTGEGEVDCYQGVIRDVTEQKRAEEALRLRTAAMEASANSIVITDRAGDIIWVNPAFTRLTGYSAEEAIGQNPSMLKSGEQDASFYRQLWDTILAGDVWHNSLVNRHKDGTLYSEEMTITPVRNGAGEISHFIAIKQDITERKRAEEVRNESERQIHGLNVMLERRVLERTAALEKSKEELEGIFFLSLDMLCIADIDGHFRRVNPAFGRILGYSSEELLERPLLDFVHPDDQAETRRMTRDKLEHGEELLHFENRYRHKDGSYRWLKWASRPLTDEGLQYAVARDVTDEKLVAEELARHRSRLAELVGERTLELTDANESLRREMDERGIIEHDLRESRERLRNLAARLHEVREEERTLIAREMHDELGQALTGLRMNLNWLADKVPKNSNAVGERISYMTSLIDSTVDTVRRLSWQLRPAILDDLGIDAAVEWHIQEFRERSGISVELHVDVGEPPLDTDRATVAFRILQEALTNVVRHSEAGHVRVELHVNDGQLILEVADDGKGIPEEHLTSVVSLGLIGMRERAGAFGGRIDFERGAEGGTVVRLTMAVASQEQE